MIFLWQCLTALVLMSLATQSAAQQIAKLTSVPYGTIVVSALNWPFIIAEQEGMLR